MPSKKTTDGSGPAAAAFAGVEPADFVTLVSNDGHEFVVSRSAACVSGALSRMFDKKNGFKESIENRAEFEDFSGFVLGKIVEYFCYNEKFKETEEPPEFEIPPEMCLELLMAADYLDSKQPPNSLLSDADLGQV
ncbi:MAG: hypothetical protein M1814_006224 [Vezdaea aestivalis]|nr:MAG: hypothetical protein M1814_006224 [Vezdaea aestivalis]